MRVGVLRRAGSFFVDFLPIFTVITLLFQFFVGEMLKPENYDALSEEYSTIHDSYFAELEQRYIDGEITLEDYQAEYDEVYPFFEAETEEHYQVLADYMVRTIFYFMISFVLVYYAYVLILKGQTLGRRVFKIELAGKINAFTLFVREIIWKLGYWMFMTALGGFISSLFIGYEGLAIGVIFAFFGVVTLDIMLITFTKNHQTLRDSITRMYVKFEGVDYPF